MPTKPPTIPESLGPEKSFQQSPLFALMAMILAGMAGGMGWGIRGQYGHETGAMIAGVLVGFTLVLLFLPRSSSLRAARVVALTAAGVSIGGSMTYGQTVGLTHDTPLIGNWDALRWGLLGLFLKGGIWIGFAGAFLGMGLSYRRYRPLDIALLLPTLFVVMFVGIWIVNSPFAPEAKILPKLYFSDHWYWEPRSDLEPRREVWGGLLLALAGLTVYLHFVRKDRLARNMALIGFLAGGLGFSGGQCVQAYHAWNPDMFKPPAELNQVDQNLKQDEASPIRLPSQSVTKAQNKSSLYQYVKHINWWNMMEITFGTIFGCILALGLWLNRHLISHDDLPGEEQAEISAGWEFILFADHVILLVAAGFIGVRMLFLYEMFGFVMCAIPLIGILGGRYWPYLFALPVVAIPIAGKTLREMSYNHQEIPTLQGWIYFVGLPLAVALLAAIWLAHLGKRGQTSRPFAGIGLLLTTWLYFGLNFGFFRLPWPWKDVSEWTGRTPSAIIFIVCAVTLTIAAVWLTIAAIVSENGTGEIRNASSPPS